MNNNEQKIAEIMIDELQSGDGRATTHQIIEACERNGFSKPTDRYGITIWNQLRVHHTSARAKRIGRVANEILGIQSRSMTINGKQLKGYYLADALPYLQNNTEIN